MSQLSRPVPFRVPSGVQDPTIHEFLNDLVPALYDLWRVSGRTKILPEKTPASASAAGEKGEIVFDSNYVYVCVDTDTWKRAALSTW